MFKILVTSKSFAKYNSDCINELNKYDIQIVRPSKGNLTSEEIKEIITEYDGLICGIDNISASVIESGKNLKIIHMNGTGVDHIDIKAASENGIYVGNCPGMNSNAVAELNLALLLAEARKLVQHSNILSERQWNRTLGVELTGKTLGVIGLGYIGRRFVELVSGFKMNILAYDMQPDMDWVKENNVDLVGSLDEILTSSDFISIHVPLTEGTEHMISTNEFNKMKSDVIIVNTARGSIIDKYALVEAIKTKKIRGAALDTFDVEPLPDDSIIRSIDGTLTPHIGASTVDAAIQVSNQVAKNIIDVLIHKNAEKMANYEFVVRRT